MPTFQKFEKLSAMAKKSSKSKDSKNESGIPDPWKDMMELLDMLKNDSKKGEIAGGDIESYSLEYIKEHPELFTELTYDPQNPSLLDINVDKVYRMHIHASLKHSPVKVVRKLVIPSNLRLEHFANILLAAFGWDGSHLYQFIIGRRDKLFVPIKQYEQGYHSRRKFDAMNYVVGDVLDEKGAEITFEYDFGDSWEHKIRLSKIEETTEDVEIEVVGGEGACPPDDCGGVWGYANLLRCLSEDADPEDREDALDWLGEKFDPKAFNLAAARSDVEYYVEHIDSSF